MASMLALYLAMRFGLRRPVWAMMTVYVVAQPFSGPVHSKALYRIAGCILGALLALLMLACLPHVLPLALAIWIGLCLYIAFLDRTPRSYIFMLAAYTAALTGFTAASDPGTMFDTALARVAEIVLGIACSTLVHSLLMPQSLGPALLARLDNSWRDARGWVADALTGEVDARNGFDRSKLAGDLTELRAMARHLPFDTAHRRWTANAIYALQQRLAALIPLLSAVEDRLHALRQLDAPGIAARWDKVLAELVAWAADGDAAVPHRRQNLRREIRQLTPPLEQCSEWTALLEMSLALRLRTLIRAGEQCRSLRRHIDASIQGKLTARARRTGLLSSRQQQFDHRQALLSSCAAALAVGLCSVLWIAGGRQSAPAAPLMAAVMGCFVAAQDDPQPGMWRFVEYALASLSISALYLVFILPAVSGFGMLILLTAPTLLLLGAFMARPALRLAAAVSLFGFVGTLSMHDLGSREGMLAPLAGLLATALLTVLLRTVSADLTVRRLLATGWRELARLSGLQSPPSTTAMAGRVLERIGELTPRLAHARGRHGWQAVDALLDLRVGMNMVQLQQRQAPREGSSALLKLLLSDLSEHFRKRPARPAMLEMELLELLDKTLRAVCADPPWRGQAAAVVALTGIRRDLFPDALPYVPCMPCVSGLPCVPGGPYQGGGAEPSPLSAAP